MFFALLVQFARDDDLAVDVGDTSQSDAVHLDTRIDAGLVAHVMMAVENLLHTHCTGEHIDHLEAMAMGRRCLVANQNIGAQTAQALVVFGPDCRTRLARQSTAPVILAWQVTQKVLPASAVDHVGWPPNPLLEITAKACDPNTFKRDYFPMQVVACQRAAKHVVVVRIRIAIVVAVNEVENRLVQDVSEFKIKPQRRCDIAKMHKRAGASLLDQSFQMHVATVSVAKEQDWVVHAGLMQPHNLINTFLARQDI